MPCLTESYYYHEFSMSPHRCYCCYPSPPLSSITSSSTHHHHRLKLYLSPSSPLILILTFLLSLILICHHVPSVESQAIEHSNASHLAVPKFFTLTRHNSALRLIANGSVARRLIASKREISFDFR